MKLTVFLMCSRFFFGMCYLKKLWPFQWRCLSHKCEIRSFKFKETKVNALRIDHNWVPQILAWWSCLAGFPYVPAPRPPKCVGSHSWNILFCSCRRNQRWCLKLFHWSLKKLINLETINKTNIIFKGGFSFDVHIQQFLDH